MTQKSSIKQKIARIASLLDKERSKEASEILAEIDPSQFSDSSPQAGYLLYFTARCLADQAKYQEALTKLHQASDILAHTSEKKMIAQIHSLFGRVYWTIGDPKKAETECRAALETFEAIGDADWIIIAYNRLSLIYMMKSDFEKAVHCYKIGIKKAWDSGKTKKAAALSHNLAMVYRKLGKWYLSEETYLLSLDVDKRTNNKLGMACHFLNLGYLFFLQRRFDEAKTHYNKAFELLTEVGEIYESCAFYIFQGELCFVLGQWETARKQYNEALRIGEEIAPEGEIINITCRLLAELELAEGNLDKALVFCDRSLEVSLKLGDRFEEGVVYKILGQIYLIKKDKQKTKEYLDKSIEVLKEIRAIYELGRSCLEAGKSDCFGYSERLKFLADAQDLFREVDTKYHIALTHLAISELLYDNNEFNKALPFIQEAEQIFKELNEKKEQEKSSKLRVEIERKAAQSKDLQDTPSKFPFSGFITQNKEMLDIIHKAEQVKDKDLTILIQGETGTGKDLLVRMIHYNSVRKNKKFVAINCANLPEALLESELFGHKKGAFTGAVQDKMGLLEVIDGGTLFLNEIGELPLSVQAKLLSVLEEKQFTRLGDTEPRKVDVRIIAATNKDLESTIENKTFREDLYYRLSVIKLNLSPLRERRQDIKLLIAHFLEKHAGANKEKVLEASNKLSELFTHYHWPGNVRELENEIIKLSTLIEIKDQHGLNRLVEQVEKEKKLKSPDSLSRKKEDLEKAEIISALRASNNVKSRAAKLLKIPEATLHRKLKKYNIDL